MGLTIFAQSSRARWSMPWLHSSTMHRLLSPLSRLGANSKNVHRLRAYQSLNCVAHGPAVEAAHSTSNWKYNQFYRQYQINCFILMLYALLGQSVFTQTNVSRRVHLHQFRLRLFFNSNSGESLVSDETIANQTQLMQIIIIICHCTILAGISIFGKSASLRLSSYSIQVITLCTALLKSKIEYWHLFEFPIKSNQIERTLRGSWIGFSMATLVHWILHNARNSFTIFTRLWLVSVPYANTTAKAWSIFRSFHLEWFGNIIFLLRAMDIETFAMNEKHRFRIQLIWRDRALKGKWWMFSS